MTIPEPRDSDFEAPFEFELDSADGGNALHRDEPATTGGLSPWTEMVLTEMTFTTDLSRSWIDEIDA